MRSQKVQPSQARCSNWSASQPQLGSCRSVCIPRPADTIASMTKPRYASTETSRSEAPEAGAVELAPMSVPCASESAGRRKFLAQVSAGSSQLAIGKVVDGRVNGPAGRQEEALVVHASGERCSFLP